MDGNEEIREENEAAETAEASETAERPAREFRGLYRHVNVSVRTLDIIIFCCIAVIILVLVIDRSGGRGLTVTFDSKGGTDVPVQEQLYGEALELPEPPAREGYRFTGWYKDAACYELWEQENDTVQSDLTLYAGWEKEK